MPQTHALRPPSVEFPRVSEKHFDRQRPGGIALGNTESSKSFEVAAKHLFRHLHEPRILRKNPLVRHFFKDFLVDGLSRNRQEYAALARIHELVRRGAKHYHDADVSDEKTERAFRQHEIITRQCLDRRPIREVAQALGISIAHCYRERSAICRRVCRYISESDRRPAFEQLAQVDEFGLLLSHARYRAEFSDADAAARALDDLVRIAPSVEQKVEALRIKALLSMMFGSLAGAEQAYSRALRLFEENRAATTPRSRDLGQASLDLLRGELAYRYGESVTPLRTAENAIGHLERHQESAPHAAGLYTESLLAFGVACWSLGKMDETYDYALRADASLRRAPASFLLRPRIRAALWKLRNYLLLDGRSWYPASQRREGLLSAFNEAFASGALGYAAETLVFLTEHYAFAGQDDEALKAGRFAARLAEMHGSEQDRLETRISIGARLLSTRYWRYAATLLAGVPSLERLDAYPRALLRYSVAERLMRTRRFQEAFALTNRKSDYSRWATLTVRNKIIAAASAHALERHRDARALIESALPSAEGLRSAPILRDAYCAAGQVTGESRFLRKAAEVAHLITA